MNLPLLSQIGQQWLTKAQKDTKLLEFKRLSSKAALQSVERIMRCGRNENDKKLRDSKWFRQQIRLTADNRIADLVTTGASQVSKSLVNYLVMIDELLNLEINTGWFYASRTSLINQQPEQFQKMIGYWIENLENQPKIYRDSVFRYSVGNSTANFSYANSDSQESKGGASEGREQSSFQASKIYVDEQSSCDLAFDPTPRLGASDIRSKPMRRIGTPGKGAGIEFKMRECVLNFVPGVRCPNCSQIAPLEPKGALLKSRYDERFKKEVWFTSRGEIIDYWGDSPETAYIVCVHCENELDPDLIVNAELYDKATLQSADEFLDELGDDVIYTKPISIYLSPLLQISIDPTRIQSLIRDGLNPVNPSIYQQNKLGYPSETSTVGVSIKEVEELLVEKPFQFERDTFRVAGIDQGRDNHFMMILEGSRRQPDHYNVLYADELSQDNIIRALTEYDIDLAIIDNEPERLAAFELSQKYKNFHLGDQKQHDDTYKLIQVRHGRLEVPCYSFNNNLYIERVVDRYHDKQYRFDCEVHRNFVKHISSIQRDYETGKWVRPSNHEDDLFFADVFVEVALSIYLDKHKTKTSSPKASNLKKLSSFKKTPLRGYRKR